MCYASRPILNSVNFLKQNRIILAISFKISNMTQNELKCNYLSGHPYLFIGPVKQETLSLNPRVVFFHDIITESGANRLKSFFKPTFLKRSVTTSRSGEILPDPSRIRYF